MWVNCTHTGTHGSTCKETKTKLYKLHALLWQSQCPSVTFFIRIVYLLIYLCMCIGVSFFSFLTLKVCHCLIMKCFQNVNKKAKYIYKRKCVSQCVPVGVYVCVCVMCQCVSILNLPLYACARWIFLQRRIRLVQRGVACATGPINTGRVWVKFDEQTFIGSRLQSLLSSRGMENRDDY